MAVAVQQFSTKERILGAAEELFALHGFSGTSLRQVTSRASDARTASRRRDQRRLWRV